MSEVTYCKSCNGLAESLRYEIGEKEKARTARDETLKALKLVEDSHEDGLVATLVRLSSELTKANISLDTAEEEMMKIVEEQMPIPATIARIRHALAERRKG